MKKLVIKITAVSVFSFISFTSLAQNAADRKPKIDGSNKTTEQTKTPAAAVAPEIVSPAIELKAEQPKTIVPGGEFKPMNTDKIVVNTKMQEIPASQAPILPAVKKAGPPPVVTEQGPSGADRAKPTPVKVIQPKQ